MSVEVLHLHSTGNFNKLDVSHVIISILPALSKHLGRGLLLHSVHGVLRRQGDPDKYVGELSHIIFHDIIA